METDQSMFVCESADDIVKCLRNNIEFVIGSDVKVVDLTYKNITPAHMIFISNALMYNTTLRKITLDYNGFGDEGVVRLCMAIMSNTTLSEIFIGLNGITDVGAECIADMLRVNKGVKALHLYANKIGKMGTDHIVDALMDNTTLDFLTMHENPISGGGAGIFRVLAKNRSLKSIYGVEVCEEMVNIPSIKDVLMNNMVVEHFGRVALSMKSACHILPSFIEGSELWKGDGSGRGIPEMVFLLESFGPRYCSWKDIVRYYKSRWDEVCAQNEGCTSKKALRHRAILFQVAQHLM